MKDINVEKYLPWTWSVADPLLRQWITEDDIQEIWRNQLTDQLATQRTREWGETFAKFCPHADASPEDYWLCEIRLESDLSVIAGINKLHDFFVRVYAQSRILEEDEYLTVGAKLLQHFSPFEPEGVRWWFSASGENVIAGLKSCDEINLVVAHLPTLVSNLSAPVGVMRRVTELNSSLYAIYVAIYEKFYVTIPSMRQLVRTESKEAMSMYAQSGMLYVYEVEGEIAGFFAASLGSEPPVSGWCVVDAILDVPYRGSGLASAALLDMLRKLDQERSELAFATIVGANEPSLQMSRRVGFHVVGKWMTLCE